MYQEVILDLEVFDVKGFDPAKSWRFDSFSMLELQVKTSKIKGKMFLF
jgi:hypothetical protein